MSHINKNDDHSNSYLLSISEAKDNLLTDLNHMRDIMGDIEKSQGRLTREDKVSILFNFPIMFAGLHVRIQYCRSPVYQWSIDAVSCLPWCHLTILFRGDPSSISKYTHLSVMIDVLVSSLD